MRNTRGIPGSDRLENLVGQRAGRVEPVEAPDGQPERREPERVGAPLVPERGTETAGAEEALRAPGRGATRHVGQDQEAVLAGFESGVEGDDPLVPEEPDSRLRHTVEGGLHDTHGRGVGQPGHADTARFHRGALSRVENLDDGGAEILRGCDRPDPGGIARSAPGLGQGSGLEASEHRGGFAGAQVDGQDQRVRRLLHGSRSG